MAQRIGKKGESLFETWAVDHHLSPNKTDEDLGVDFFCQVLRSKDASTSEDVTGAVLGVHVRATEGKTRPRILLDRIDAIDLLQHSHPACLIGIQANTGQIGVLFVEESFIDRLQDFLRSSRKTLSIRLDEMELDSAKFDRKLMDHVRPGVQQRVAVYKAQRTIQSVAPGASLSVQHTSSGGSAVVDLPWVTSALTIDPKTRDDVRVLAFEKGKSPDEWPGVSLRPEFLPLLDLADGPAFLRGAVEREEEMVVECDGQRASTTFRIRRAADEFAYVHELGLALVSSDRRRRQKEWVHEMEARLFRGSTSLGDGTDALPFFRLLRVGAQFVRSGAPISIDTWGEATSRIGCSVHAIENVVRVLGLNLRDFYLGDLQDEEFGNSLGFLDALLIENSPAGELIPAFIADPDLEGDVDSMPTENVTMDLPVVLNLQAVGIVIWIRARVAMFLSADRKWCGVRVLEQLKWSHSVHPRIEKSAYPELWMMRFWPTVPIGQFQPGVHTVRHQEPEKFFVEARVVPSDDASEDPQAAERSDDAAEHNHIPEPLEGSVIMP